MKAKELAQLLELVVRKVVREELKPILSEVKKSQKPIIREVKSKKVRVEKDPLDINLSEILAATPEIETEQKTFIKNPMLNEMLNEVADSGEWRNLNDSNSFTSNQAQGFTQGNSAAPTTDIDGRPIDMSNPEVANVMGAITKDYSQLLKAMDKKKGR
tara:strand:+ start:1874 stop:2347 length:474 start_codon:yes stop_codon:yes gene_type:complete